jgi:hypothetical protein
MIVFEDRPSDSPYVERVWRSYSEQADPFISIAVRHSELVIEKLRGKLRLYLRGPETKATPVNCPPDGEWIGILLKFGTFMPRFPTSNLIDQAVVFPEASSRSFWLNGSVWQFPTYENADTFVDRLVREGYLVHEPVVDTFLQGQPNPLSIRSAQRRFLRATGMSHTVARQIERARYATLLLQQGVSILDTVYQAGYFDQPHLTKSLRRFIGLTPLQIMAKSQQLSFFYEPNHPVEQQ